MIKFIYNIKYKNKPIEKAHRKQLNKFLNNFVDDIIMNIYLDIKNTSGHYPQSGELFNVVLDSKVDQLLKYISKKYFVMLPFPDLLMSYVEVFSPRYDRSMFVLRGSESINHMSSYKKYYEVSELFFDIHPCTTPIYSLKDLTFELIRHTVISLNVLSDRMERKVTIGIFI